MSSGYPSIRVLTSCAATPASKDSSLESVFQQFVNLDKETRMPRKDVITIHSSAIKQQVKAAQKDVKKAIALGERAVKASATKAKAAPTKTSKAVKDNTKLLNKAKDLRELLNKVEKLSNSMCPLQVAMIQFDFTDI